MWEPQAPTYFYTHTHTHTYCALSLNFLMKIKVYRNITDWMILIVFTIDWIDCKEHIFTSQVIAYPMNMDGIIPEFGQYG